MFRKRRSQSTPPAPSAPTPAAATAAAQAFLSHRSSNASLSSAAAAAALRSHAGSPTPVANVQTKRMVQRQASVSSRGSIGGTGRQTNGLQRRGSSGSMTERTFRESPSPRPSSPVAARPDAPPVPALPSNLKSLPSKANRRAASAEPPMRVSSPTSPKGSLRGSSMDRAGGYSTNRGGNRVMSLSSVSELDRSDSKGSVNFSYPKNSWKSPPASPVPGQQSSSPVLANNRPISPVNRSKQPSQGLQPAEISSLQSTIQDTSNRPVTKRQQKHAKHASEGSYLAKGTSGGRPTGTSVAGTKSKNSESLPTKTPNKSQHTTEKTIERRSSVDAGTNGALAERDMESAKSHEKDNLLGISSEIPTSIVRHAGQLTKQPSTVREDHEPREAVDRQVNGTTAVSSSNAPKRRFKSSSQPPPEHPTLTGDDNRLKVIDKADGSIRVGRNQSLSPVRSAHFSPTPTYATPDGPKHQPLPRSVSPAKSALKHSPSPRAESPFGPPGVGRGYTPSETSETPSLASDEGGQRGSRKKKNVRVSFEDDSTVIGQAASPPESPVALSQHSHDSPSRGWFGLGRKKQDETADHARDEGLDDLLPPRPALPSFGSVRGRKERDDGSEQSEKNPETLETTQPSSIFTSSTGDRIEIPTDQVIDGTMGQDSASSKPPANEASLSTIGEEKHLETNASRGEGTQSVNTKGTVDQQNHKVEKPPSNTVVNGTGSAKDVPFDDDVPAIAVVPATPALEETESWLGMPGTFPTSADSLEDKEPKTRKSKASRPVLNISKASRATGADRRDTSREEDSDDSNSIYSDAAEDLSDFEGDGFGSINAIVESPTLEPGLAITTPPESPSIQLSQQSMARPLEEPDEPASNEGWDKARAYWSSLSDQRRQEIEAEAAEKGPHPPGDLFGGRLDQEAVRRTRQDKTARTTNGTTGKSVRLEKATPSSVKKSPTGPAPVPQKSALRKQTSPTSTGAAGLSSSLSSGSAAQYSLAAPRTRQSSKPSPAMSPNDSDSDASASSFRKRRRSASDSGRVSMRRTMRGSSEAANDGRPLSSAGAGSGKYSLRSASPTGSTATRPMSPSMSTRSMRTSMRSPSNKAPSLRNKRAEPPSSPSLFPGFGKAKGKKSTRSSSTRFSSRFADSSDEDDIGLSSRFRSRFNDSSDEELPTKLAPVRGIPRKKGQEDGDSTDLSDSSGDEEAPSRQIPSTSRVNESNAQTSGHLRQTSVSKEFQAPIEPTKAQNRRSFFGSLGRKKGALKDTPPFTELGAVGVSQPEHNETNGHGAQSSPRNPKLRRRNTPSYVRAATADTTSSDRPKTSDGAVGASSRPDLGTRRATDEQNRHSSYDPAYGRSGKKKKFPKLRKVFGLL